jgi:hypothetical protein
MRQLLWQPGGKLSGKSGEPKSFHARKGLKLKVRKRVTQEPTCRTGMWGTRIEELRRYA